MSSSTRIATIFGVPIRVHITLWIFLPLIALNFSGTLGLGSILWGALAATGLFASVALHELGHSIVAIARGCRVREILLLPIGGVAQLEGLPRNPRDEMLIAVAGPAVSLLLFLSFGAVALFFHLLRLMTPALLFGMLSGINLMLALFNLLPSFPMDGGRIFRAWMTPRVGRLEATRRAAIMGRVMAVLFGLIGFFQGNIFLMGIAVFIYVAAGAEYRMVAAREAYRLGRAYHWPSWEEELPVEDVTISPPPYRRRHVVYFIHPSHLHRRLFDEVLEKW